MNEQRLQNFATALNSLEEYVRQPIQSKRDSAGLVFGFLLAFELAWKCVQDKVNSLGYTERGPKPVLAAALQAGLIGPEDEEVWAVMLQDRNPASHTYKEQFASEVAGRIIDSHALAMRRVLSRLQ